MTWEEVKTACENCTACKLASTRTNIVFGRGNENAKLMFVGEAPGENEDLQGLPFVGTAGSILTLALDSIGFEESDYYITNILKCRPPENRNPELGECRACIGFLRAQFALMRPKIVVCLGSIATRQLIDKDAMITKIRGQFTEKQGVLFLPTYHPAALLRDPGKKLAMWEDLKLAYNTLRSL